MLTNVDYNLVFGESKLFFIEDTTPKESLALELPVKDRAITTDGIANWILPAANQSENLLEETEESRACQEFQEVVHEATHELDPQTACTLFETVMLLFPDSQDREELFKQSELTSLDAKISFLVGASIRYYQWTVARSEVNERSPLSSSLEKKQITLILMDKTPSFSHPASQIQPIDSSIAGKTVKMIEACQKKYKLEAFFCQQLAAYDPPAPFKLLRDHIVLWLQNRGLDPTIHRYLLANENSESAGYPLNRKAVWYTLSNLDRTVVSPLFASKSK